MAFATIALAELVFVYSIRSPTRPAWREPGNRVLALSVVASAAVVLLGIYLPLGQELLGTEPLDGEELAVVLTLAVTPSLVTESAKLIRRRRSSVREE
jgi:magnesium-transporting ATPase (P-type)